MDNTQFGFLAGKRTTDAIFVVGQLQEKYLAKKYLFMSSRRLREGFLHGTERGGLVGLEEARSG